MRPRLAARSRVAYWVVHWLALGAILALLFALPSCLRTGLEKEPRYASVRNALSALGLTQSGPILRGSLREGQENRIRLAIGSECATVIAFGGDEIADLDISLRDAEDHVLARDTTSDSQATMRICAIAAGSYTLVVRAAHGSGDFMASLWTGKGGGASGSGAGRASETAGTCESPTPLSPGTFVSSTSRGSSNEEGSCGSTDGKEIVYQFSLSERRRVTLEVESQFESVLYVRRDDCSDTSRELTCRDATGRETAKKNRVDTVLEAGVYYAVVDGSETGSFRLTFDSTAAPDLAALCRDAPALGSHRTITNWSSRVDLTRASCGTTNGPEAPFRLDIGQPTRVRIKHKYDAGMPVIHVRKSCTDPQSEVGCSDSGHRENEASYVGLLQPGRYLVFADTALGEVGAASEVTYESQPAAGRGTPEDTCSGALPLVVGETIADTFDAIADVQMRCLPQATPDVFYRLNVPSRMHVTIRQQQSEAQHVFGFYKSCGTAPQLVECGGMIDAVVNAGTYFLGVHGANPSSFGEVSFQTQMEDVTARETACKGATPIRLDQTVKGNTKGGPPVFATRCFGGTSSQRVHRLVITKNATVELALKTTGFRGLISIRSACLDGGDLSGEINCNVERGMGGANGELTQAAVFSPGTYFIVISGAQSGFEGAYTLRASVTPQPIILDD